MIESHSPRQPASPESATLSRRAAPARARRGRRWIAPALVLLLLLVLALLVGRVAAPGWQAYRATGALLETAGGGLEAAEAPLVTQQIVALDGAVQRLADRTRPLDGVLGALAWLPTWGPTVAASPELLAFGREFSAMGAELAPMMGAALQEEGAVERGAALLAALADDPARLERLALRAEAAAAAYTTIDVSTLHPALAGRLENVGPLLDVLPLLLKALPGLPVLLGMEEPHTILILVQSNHELRATGGFITAVGRVTLDKGKIAEMDFSDSYVIYRNTSEYPPAPAPMRTFMGIPYMTFRDSNWSPDLPTTSRIARSIYTMDTRKDFDSVLTIDLDAVGMIIDALSPLRLAGIDEPVTGANILGIMKELWARPPDAEVSIEEDLGKWWRERKNFIPLLAQAVLDKVMGGDADYLAVAGATVRAFDQRDLQLYTQVDAVAPVLAELGWDGALQPLAPNTADYIALVDTNMGYNKVNAVIDRSLAYSVTWPAEGADDMRPIATATITYTHNYTGEANLCAPEAVYGKTYDDMIHRCYFNYMRLYVPGGSELVEITGVDEDSTGSARGEKGTQVFAGYFSMAPGESKPVTVRYYLPETVAPESYNLRIQRQSGTGPLPVMLKIGEWEDVFVLTKGRIDWQPPED